MKGELLKPGWIRANRQLRNEQNNNVLKKKFEKKKQI